MASPTINSLSKVAEDGREGQWKTEIPAQSRKVSSIHGEPNLPTSSPFGNETGCPATLFCLTAKGYRLDGLGQPQSSLLTPKTLPARLEESEVTEGFITKHFSRRRQDLSHLEIESIVSMTSCIQI